MTATVKFVSTVDSKLSQLQIENGQLIFASDTRKIYLDFNGVRTEYSQFIILETEAQRQELLAPIRAFYFVDDTKCFWQRSKEGWTQLTSPPKEKIKFLNKNNFPLIGEEEILYITETQTYKWNGTEYVQLGLQEWESL